MPTPTYDLIEEQVLGSAVNTVTFGSGGTLTQAYKDLVLEIVCTTASTADVAIRFNGDTGSNYSGTYVYGITGNVASSARSSNGTFIFNNYYAASLTSVNRTSFVNIMSYTNTNVNKTTIGRAGTVDNGTEAIVGLWRNTAAITSITVITTGSQNFTSGSVFRLWGIVG